MNTDQNITLWNIFRGRQVLKNLLAGLVIVSGLATLSIAWAADPLPSWNDGKAKQSILDFVAKVTKEGSPDFVPPAERIATFDNDGTLWGEKPMYVQLVFLRDRLKAIAPERAEGKTNASFLSRLENDTEGIVADGERAMHDISMTTDEFDKVAKDWLATARHPTTKKLYTGMVYQPMLEVLAYLRANGFKTFIVSGGGIEFMRASAEKVYGIPPEQIVGSSIKTKFEMRDGKPVLVRLPELNFYDDKGGKPVAIQQHIGRRPIAAFGNSDGDLQMLQWTTGGSGTRFGLIVHHTDAAREWAYDRDTHVGKLDVALTQAPANGWTVVDMKQDWKVVYPAE